MEVSVIGLGCWAFAGGGNWGAQDDKDSISAVHAALDAGINLFDTAEAYGDGYSEQILGKALAGGRDRAIVATKPKTQRARPDEIRSACEESLERLGTDYIDLYQLHWPNREVPFSETVNGLERLKAEGKIRAYGVCNFGAGDLTDITAITDGVDTNQVAYNLLWRGAEYEVLPACRDHGIGVLCYSPLAQALLTGKYEAPEEVPVGRARTKHFSDERERARHGREGTEDETFRAIDRIRGIAGTIGVPTAHVAIGWLLAQPGVSSVLAGGRRAEQVEQNAAAADVKLDEATIARLTEATDELKAKLGAETDPWADRMR